MRRGWLIAGGIVLVLVAGGGGGLISYGSDQTLPKGILIQGVSIEEDSAEDALQAIQMHLDKMRQLEITVTPPVVKGTPSAPLPHPTRTLEQLGMHIEAEKAIQAIQEYRDASWWERAILRYHKKLVNSYPIQLTWDEEMLEQVVTSSWGNAAGAPPVDASRVINNKDQVTYTPEVIGTKLDTLKLIRLIKDSVNPAASRTFELPVIQTSPEVTLASLKEEGIERKIIEFTTSFESSGEGRAHNVTAAAKALNETLLMPGELFEYSKIVTKAEKAYGYKEAPVILNGKLTPGIGGGICQISSTLYNAALLTGLEIVERRNHSLVVGYLPKGLDATFAEGYVNFKFRNTTGKQLLIRAVVIDKKLTIKLFGTMPEEVSYQTETIQIKETPSKIVYVANNKLTLGKQEVLQKGSPGYVVESYLIKQVNGKEHERKKLARDTYRSQNALIAVNPNDPKLVPDSSIPTPSPAPEGSEGLIEPI